MKWVRRGLLVVIGLPLVLLGVLLAAGLRADAGKLRADVTIAAGPEAVFAHFQDPGLLQEWLGVERVQPLTQGAFGVGTRFRMTVSARAGNKTEMDAEVLEVTPGRQLTLSFRTLPGSDLALQQVVQFRLEGNRDRSRVALEGTTRYEGLWLRVLEPLATAAVERRAERNLGRLKRIAESGRGK
ncbi:MAG TPA: SRPBCC family protein [Vicinamibacteria bacterium]